MHRIWSVKTLMAADTAVIEKAVSAIGMVHTNMWLTAACQKRRLIPRFTHQAVVTNTNTTEGT